MRHVRHQKSENKQLTKTHISYCVDHLLFNAGRGLSSAPSSYVIKPHASQFSLSYELNLIYALIRTESQDVTVFAA